MKSILHSKGYAIKCHTLTERGLLTCTMGRDENWYSATNDGSFTTLLQARQFFNNSKYAAAKLSVWIEGPMGGTHSAFKKVK